MLAPPFTDPARLDDVLCTQGHAVLSPQALQSLLQAGPDALRAWQPFWDRLPPDAYLRDGGRYRRRRHANYVVADGRVQPVPHRAHWQPVEYNALHGGIERWFEPVESALEAQPLWQPLLLLLAQRADALRGVQPWYVEAHVFRIDTTDGIGRPTPEGAHRDGVDMVAVLLMDRQGIKGGETRVFDANGPQGLRFTMSEPGTLLMLDDTRVIHETTPIQPTGEAGWRDTLVVTLRKGGFQGPHDPLHR